MIKLFFHTRILLLLTFSLHFFSGLAQEKFPADFRERMRKYKVRFEHSIFSEKTDTLLLGFSLFQSKKSGLDPGFVMYKNPSTKMNVAYYIDTCFNHYNLEEEVRNDLPVLFGINDKKKSSIESQDLWSVMLNADEVMMTGVVGHNSIPGSFVEYNYTSIICYYNHLTKGKIYVVANFEGDINNRFSEFLKTLMEFSFTPHPPSSNLEPELVIQSGSNDEIDAIAVSKSGKLLAYGGLQGHIKIALGDGSKELRTIKAHNKQIVNLEFSMNERLVVSCSEDSTIKIWEVETGKLVAELIGHKNRVNDIVFFDRDRKLMSSSSDSTLKFWNIVEKKCFKTMNGFKNKTAQIELSTSGKRAIINLLKGNIMLLNLETFTDTVLKSGFERITDFAMPYSNAIAVSNGKAVKFIYTDSKVERIISTEEDSAYSRMVSIDVNDTTNNTRLLLLTDNGYGKLYDYNEHAFKKTIHYENFNTQKYYSLGFNYKYNMAIYGGVTFCTTYDLDTDEFNFIQGTGIIPHSIEPDGQNEIVAINYKNIISLFSLRSGRIIWNSSTAKVSPIGLGKVNKFNSNLAFISPDSLLCSYDYQKNKLTYGFKPVSFPIYFQPLVNDSTFIYLTKEKEVMLHTNRKDKSIVKSYALKELNLVRDTFLLYQDKGSACLKNVYTDKIIVLGEYNLYTWLDLSGENANLFSIRTKDTAIYIFDKWTFKKVNEFRDKKFINDVLFYTLNPVKNEMAIVCNNYELKVVNLETKQLIKKWRPHVGYLWKVIYTNDGRFIVTAGTDAFVKVWESKNYSNVTSTYSASYGSYITLTPENYYVASASFTKEANVNMAYYSYGNTVFDLADLDIEYNRPDIISGALGYESEEIVAAYKKLHEKRMKRLHIANAKGLINNNRPILRSAYTYPPEVHKSALKLFFVLHDDYKKLKNIKITINDVPVHGVEGTSIIDGYDLASTSSIPIAFTIFLNKGWNKVSVKITNEDNVESYPYTFSTWYSNPENDAKPKLHIIGIGVSKFKDSKYNLKYPAKDIRDVIKLFQNQKNQYSSIIVDTLLNDSATLENILKLKEKIKRDHKDDSVGVNDKVMIFAATHGMLDKNLDYYLATYDVNFENPSEKGLLYSEIENLLDHISPRNKVVLIDACHSGEIDKDEIVVTKSEPIAENGAVAFRSTSSNKISSSEGLLKNSMNLMKEMFIDLRKTSGATVISSAGGTEYAMEGEEWNNGVFSYSLINALRKHKADGNNDGKVYLSELQKYIEVDVPAITQGKQQPTSRSENISNDVLIWKNDFNEELASAIKADDKELVDKLIKDGADVTAVDTGGATTLMWAVLYSDLAMVKKLVAAKADINARGVIYTDPTNRGSYYGNLTGIAVANKKMDILKYLIEEKKVSVNDCEYNPVTKKPDGWPAIAYAVSVGNMEMMNYLLSKGADVNLLLEAQTNYGLEQLAFFKGDKEICERLITKGLNYKRIETGGNSIVTKAAASANPEVLKLALKLNKGVINFPTTDSLFPIMNASFYGRVENFKILVKAGSNTKVRTKSGQTIVHMASRSNSSEMLKEALAVYPDAINIRENQGLSPLLLAAIEKNIEGINILLANGADLTLKDINGATFEDYAKYYNNKEMLELIKKYTK
ncbi:MAG: ankyrin repeat domain-containing protein [Bacteroidota bacterium]|nr:ankyrin repeat domain-containing protein [Bacteroidota bacterium]